MGIDDGAVRREARGAGTVVEVVLTKHGWFRLRWWWWWICGAAGFVRMHVKVALVGENELQSSFRQEVTSEKMTKFNKILALNSARPGPIQTLRTCVPQYETDAFIHRGPRERTNGVHPTC